MKFERTQVSGFENAFYGMRNPRNSWNKSDSYFGIIDVGYHKEDTIVANAWAKNNNDESEESINIWRNWLHQEGILQIAENSNGAQAAFIGPADMKLARTLIKAGPEHRKFLRQINVSVDITAPLYWWKELDTYKIGTTANSTSTMHTLTDEEITIDCFEIDDYEPNLITALSVFDEKPLFDVSFEVKYMLNFLNTLREKYLETKDSRYWKELVRWLPESWLQIRTWSANYEVLFNISCQREGHKLTEWKQFIDWIYSLPYVSTLFNI